MKLFKKNKEDKVEARFQNAINLVKDLDRREFNRLMDGLALAWQSYNKIRTIQTIDEKELNDISSVEKILELEEKK